MTWPIYGLVLLNQENDCDQKAEDFYETTTFVIWANFLSVPGIVVLLILDYLLTPLDGQEITKKEDY